MEKVLFVCYGNICRSPMAEFIFKDMIKNTMFADKIYVESAAISTEEIGNPVYHLAKEKLASVGISCEGKVARQLTKQDYEEFDYIVGMEDANIEAILNIVGSDARRKVRKLDRKKDIADPWYTRDFDTAYNDIRKGCEHLFRIIAASSVL